MSHYPRWLWNFIYIYYSPNIAHCPLKNRCYLNKGKPFKLWPRGKRVGLSRRKNMNLGEKAHQRLMTPNSCVEISPRKFNIFPIDLILKVIVILICFHLDCKADSRLQCQFTFLVGISKHFSPCVCLSLWESGLITGQKRPPPGSLFAQIN